MRLRSYLLAEDCSRVFQRRLLPKEPLHSKATRIVEVRNPEGQSLRGRLRSKFVDWISKIGEQYVEAQTSDTNNVWPVIPRRLETFPGIRFVPDSIDFSFGAPPVVGDVKVGGFGSYEQAEDLVAAVKGGRIRPGTIYLLESPVSGKGRARPWIEAEMKRVGYDFVSFDGPWWEFFQDGQK